MCEFYRVFCSLRRAVQLEQEIKINRMVEIYYTFRRKKSEIDYLIFIHFFYQIKAIHFRKMTMGDI